MPVHSSEKCYKFSAKWDQAFTVFALDRDLNMFPPVGMRLGVSRFFLTPVGAVNLEIHTVCTKICLLNSRRADRRFQHMEMSRTPEIASSCSFHKQAKSLTSSSAHCLENENEKPW